MTIQLIQFSPLFLRPPISINPKLSALDLDREFCSAFEDMDIERAAELLKAGANPNQNIAFSKPIVLNFLIQMGECDCSGKVDLDNYKSIISNFLEDPQNCQSVIDEFFSG
ncbi:MAG: hypothetical protein S4CHLAM7_12000 [Chlamydiae bacterium]|nr:hypothetical protein [Chlamydiota bacterium]